MNSQQLFIILLKIYSYQRISVKKHSQNISKSQKYDQFEQSNLAIILLYFTQQIMIGQRMTKSSVFRIKTQQPNNTLQLLNEKSKYHRYDTSLYHKTNYHLRPLKDNPELFTKVESSVVPKLVKINQTNMKRSNTQNKQANNSPKKMISLPQSISIRAELTKIAGLQKSIEKLLQEDTMMLVTAKKWIVFDMQTNITLKGFKHKKEHDIASLTKVLTFYTAYMIIQKYYLSIDRLELIIDEQDQNIQGTKINIKDQYLITLQDLLYAMMLESANNAATAIATNLGSLVRKKREGKYFSCFDIPNEDKNENMQVFLELMNSFAIQLGLTNSTFINCHGMCKNKSTARDIAIITSECYKIPLFSKIVLTKYYTLKAKYVSNNGEIKIKDIPLTNTNRLLWLGSGCVGGKTGCNTFGGQSLVACYEGGIIVVVLGSVGREEKFADSQKLIAWLYTKLRS